MTNAWDNPSWREARNDYHRQRGADFDPKPNGGDNRQQSPKFPLLKFSQLQFDSAEVAYVVKGVIPRTGLIVVWGPPKCGKSFWLMDLLLHVAFNWVYRGIRVTVGPIVYCAFEGASGFGKRAAAFRNYHDVPDDEEVPFFLSPLRMDLIRDHQALIESIKSELPDDKPPIVVALDTLNRSLVGSESRDEDMGAYIGAADAIREAFGCAVIIVHHCGIEASRPRGHTSLTGAVDVQIKVERDDASNVIVTLEYAKDGEEGATFVSRLERVVVGQDPDGDSATSCAVIPGDASAAIVKSRSKSKAADPLRDALTAAFDGGEKITPYAGMSQVFGVKCRDVLAHFKRRYMARPSEGQTAEKLAAAQERAFYRALKNLPAAEFGQGVVNDQQWIWRKHV